MTITLTIENPEALGGAGAPRFQASHRSFAIGRDGRMDWSLPDPSRFVSSRHCEIRFENGGYWLHDTSTNGVFVNGAGDRPNGPHRLGNGDRLRIGPYRIAVSIEGGGAQGFRAPNPPPARTGGDWGFAPSTAAPQPVHPTPPRADPRRHPPFAHGAPHTGLPQPPAAGGDRGSPSDFLEAFCAGAGIAPDALSHLDPDALAREIGAFARLAAEGVSDLLRARASAKAMTKSASRTVVTASDNNPLKHVPTAAEAVEVMFGRRRPGYLDARRSLTDAFGDLKRHEIATYAAMQQALGKLLEPLSPEAVEVKAGGSAFSSKKARAWEIFVERWRERDAGPNGMLDAFLAYFAEAYDEADKRRS